LGGLLGKRLPEELSVGRDPIQFGGLEANGLSGTGVIVQHPVSVEQQ
jgi:hypothetical protein